MEATINYNIAVPSSDEPLLRTLIERMGWRIRVTRRTARLDAAIKAADTEPLFESNDINAVMADLMS